MGLLRGMLHVGSMVQHFKDIVGQKPRYLMLISDLGRPNASAWSVIQCRTIRPIATSTR